MQRMWRRLFAAVLGVLSVSGLASAQNQLPTSVPVEPVRSAPISSPIAAPQYVAAPQYAAPIPVQSPAQAAATPIRPVAGCTSCGSPAAVNSVGAGQFANYGPRDRNGCGSLRSDCGFVFGSCKSFFDPCGPLPCGGGRGRGCGVGGCPAPPLNVPYGTKYSGCVYDSYLNH